MTTAAAVMASGTMAVVAGSTTAVAAGGVTTAAAAGSVMTDEGVSEGGAWRYAGGRSHWVAAYAGERMTQTPDWAESEGGRIWALACRGGRWLEKKGGMGQLWIDHNGCIEGGA